MKNPLLSAILLGALVGGLTSCTLTLAPPRTSSLTIHIKELASRDLSRLVLPSAVSATAELFEGSLVAGETATPLETVNISLVVGATPDQTVGTATFQQVSLGKKTIRVTAYDDEGQVVETGISEFTVSSAATSVSLNLLPSTAPALGLAVLPTTGELSGTVGPGEGVTTYFPAGSEGTAFSLAARASSPSLLVYVQDAVGQLTYGGLLSDVPAALVPAVPGNLLVTFYNPGGTTATYHVAAAFAEPSAGKSLVAGLTTWSGYRDAAVTAGGGVNGVDAPYSFLRIPESSPYNGLYVSDWNTNSIKRIDTTNGTVTTVWGKDRSAGNQDGVGTNARFVNPYDMVWDGDSHVYVADSAALTIRKIDLSTNNVSTIAGKSFDQGTTNGTGTAATFWSPRSLALDGTTLYIADLTSTSSMIRALDTTTGAVTTFAGSADAFYPPGGVTAYVSSVNWQPLSSLTLGFVRGLAVDPAAHLLYVLDRNNRSIYRIALSGYSTAAVVGCYYRWVGVNVDDVNTIIPIAKAYVDGAVNPGKAVDPNGSLRTPQAMYLDTESEPPMLYVLDATSGVILNSSGYAELRSLDADPSSPFPTIGTLTSATALSAAPTSASYGYQDGGPSSVQMRFPTGLVADGNLIYIAERTNQTVRVWDLSTQTMTTLVAPLGRFLTVDGSADSARFDYPSYQTTDGRYLYVSDYRSYVIRRISLTDGSVITLAGTLYASGAGDTSDDGTGTSAKFVTPQGLCLLAGKLYVADGNAIRVVDPETAQVTTLELPGVAFYGLGALTTDGTWLYALETANSSGILTGSIYQIDPSNGEWGVVAGNPELEEPDAGLGSGSAVHLNAPYDFTWVNGALYVLDTSNFRIVRVDPNDGWKGTVLAGSGIAGVADGIKTAASFTSLTGVTSDGVNLYVTDSSVVRKVVIATGQVSTLVGQQLAPGFVDGAGANGQLLQVMGIQYVGGALYVSDAGNGTIRVIY